MPTSIDQNTIFFLLFTKHKQVRQNGICSSIREAQKISQGLIRFPTAFRKTIEMEPWAHVSSECQRRSPCPSSWHCWRILPPATRWPLYGHIPLSAAYWILLTLFLFSIQVSRRRFHKAHQAWDPRHPKIPWQPTCITPVWSGASFWLYGKKPASTISPP